MSKFKNK